MPTIKYADLNSLSRFKTKIEAEIPTKVSELTNDSGFITSTPEEVYIGTTIPTDASATLWINPNDIAGTDFEIKSNKVTSISSSSTNTQYPSAKAVYDYIQSLDASEVSY